MDGCVIQKSWMLRFDGVVVCTALLSACTSFGSAERPGPGDADAASPSVPDATAASEAGADGGPLQVCAGRATRGVVFCDDFEATESPLLSDARWTDIYPDGAVVQVVDAAVTGRSRALQTRVKFPSSSERSVWIRKELTPAAKVPSERSRYRLSFSFSVTESNVTYAGIGAVWLTVDGAPSLLHGGALVESGTGARPTDPSSASPVPIGKGWHDVVVALEKGTAGWSRQVTIDGTPLAAEMAPDMELAYQLDLRLGVYYAHGTDGIVDLMFDDVLVEAF